MDRPVDPELGEPAHGVVHARLGEQRLQLVAEPRGRELADEVHLDARPCEREGVRIHREAVAVLVADRPEDPGRVVDEGQVVEDADDAVLEVAETAEIVDEAAEVLALQGTRPSH